MKEKNLPKIAITKIRTITNTIALTTIRTLSQFSKLIFERTVQIFLKDLMIDECVFRTTYIETYFGKRFWPILIRTVPITTKQKILIVLFILVCIFTLCAFLYWCLSIFVSFYICASLSFCFTVSKYRCLPVSLSLCHLAIIDTKLLKKLLSRKMTFENAKNGVRPKCQKLTD